MTRGPLLELLERRRAFCYLSALDDPLVAAVRLAGLIGEPVEGRRSRRQLLPAMSAVASEQPVPAMTLPKCAPWAEFDVGIGYTARIQERAVEAATSVGQVKAALASLPDFPVLYGQCWPGMTVQGQLLFPSQEAVDSLDK